MTFRVGQKVICINSGTIVGQPVTYRWDEGEEIREGAIYTIHSAFISPYGIPVVRLCEVKRTAKTLFEWGHDGYGAERFRPIVERKTDISVFTAMLNPSKQGVTA